MTKLRMLLFFRFFPDAPVAATNRLREAIIGDRHTRQAYDTVSGNVDLVVEAEAGGPARFERWIAGLRSAFPGVVRSFECSMVSHEYHPQERCLWLTRHRGTDERIPVSAIDKVVAEGDYMRVFAKGRSWLQHIRLKEIGAMLPEALQLNRSVLVRRDFIERVHHASGRWIAELADGTRQRVTAAHLEALREFVSIPSTNRAISSNVVEFDPQAGSLRRRSD